MPRDWESCLNCGGVVDESEEICARCGECRHDPGSGQPQFTPEARDAPDGLGGLLTIHSVPGKIVRYVGHCAGGAIEIDEFGKLIWRDDWGYVRSIIMDSDRVFVDNIPIDVDSGRSTLR